MAEYKIDIEKSAQNILDKIYERFGISAERLVELAQADQDGRCVVLTNETDYIPRQAVIDLLYYYADEACSAIVGDVEKIPGVCVGIDDSWLMKRFTEVI